MPLILIRAGIPGVNINSWDTCMAKAYCKWPVIIGIIVVSVFILSLVWCCARCLCCGLNCCCDCFSCCGTGGGGRNNRNRGDKYADPPQNFQPAPYHQGYQQPPYQSYQQPPPNQGYQQPPPNNQGYGPGPVDQGYTPAHQQPAYEPPQFAQFDVSKKPVNEDALPAMPSWENATSRKVLEEHAGEDMEMGTLGPAQTQRVPMLPTTTTTTQAPSPPAGYAEASSYTLDNPYHHHQQQQQPNAYNGAGLRSQGSQAYGAASQPQWGSSPHAYSDQPPQPAYSAYSPSPSASTRYAPSSAYEQQEMGTIYNPTSPPPQQQQQAPSTLLAGRKPVPNTWRDV